MKFNTSSIIPLSRNYDVFSRNYVIFSRKTRQFSRNYEIFSRNYEIIRREFNFKHDTNRLSQLSIVLKNYKYFKLEYFHKLNERAFKEFDRLLTVTVSNRQNMYLLEINLNVVFLMLQEALDNCQESFCSPLHKCVASRTSHVCISTGMFSLYRLQYKYG